MIMTRDLKDRVLPLHKEGKTNLQIEELTGISMPSIRYAINSSGLKSNRYSWENLSHEASEFVLGSLLGDGHFDKYGRLCFGHSEHQKEYIYYKDKTLNDFGIETTAMSYYITNHVRYKAPFGTYTLKTRRRPEFKVMREKYFENGHKIVPEEEYVNEFLTPFALAVWFMDDGNAASHNNLQLSTDSFSRESVNMLRFILLDKFQVRSTINSRNAITIRSDSYLKFISLIDEFVLPSMKYKYKLRVLNKSDKLLEHPEVDNQQPITTLNE